MIQIKLKNCIETYSGYAFSSKDFCDDGVQIIKIGNLFNNKLSLERSPTFVSEGFLLSHHEYIASEGDILISLTGTLGKKDYGYAVAIDKKCEFLVNQRVLKISAKHNITQEYLLFLLQSEYLLNELYPLANGTKQANISASDVLNIGVSLPSIDEQKSISKLLGVKVSIIDTKVKNLTQKLHHLEEYKTALIHNAVTKGLDANNCRILDGTPAEEMKWKDSGVEWIGEIPDDASAIRLRDSVTSFKTGSRDTNHYVENGLYDFFTCGKEIRKINDKPFSGEAILINGNGDVGKARLVNTEFDAYQRVYVLQGMKVSSYLLCEQINLGLPNELKRDKKGSVIAFATLGDITGFKIVSFNKNESLSISNYLEKSNQLFEQCTNAINKKIALLLEYKKSLINEAVSGQ
ncbi:hypothetical protein DZF72_07325 [Vibrio parahaemolyticus]|nr:hypothetical protein [Vibrio parahaemolyticus]